LFIDDFQEFLMDWEFTAGQIIDNEIDVSLTDFTKKLYDKTAEKAMMSLDTSVEEENVVDDGLSPLEDFRVQYFICYYNYMLCKATEKSRRQFMSHTKKHPFSKNIKKKFLDKKYLVEIDGELDETVDIFSAVLKRFVSELIESGTSTNRLPQMLMMQQLNSFSSIVPNIMKNEKARSMVMHIEFENGFLGAKLKKLFK